MKTPPTSPFHAGARTAFCTFVAGALLGATATRASETSDPFAHHTPPPLTGRWDLKVHGPSGDFPSWIEVDQSGYRTLVGRYVGQFGSARPIGHVELDGSHFKFVVPPQWEHTTRDIVVEGSIEGGVLRGTTTDVDGKPVPWDGRRSDPMVRNHPPRWGKPIHLYNGKDLTGWRPRNPSAQNGWRPKDAVLANVEPGNDLVTEQKFTDFRLHAEFRYPKGSNSGIYLRGRHEVQIEDDYGLEPDSHYIGGVYGFLTPRVNASKPAGEWQTMDITLVGRVVTVALNGEAVIERQTIPGITGGALDGDEEQPGPLLIQGDHGPVEFRNLIITPAE
jgi:Domain of Unknown Function (DUF1080)